MHEAIVEIFCLSIWNSLYPQPFRSRQFHGNSSTTCRAPLSAAAFSHCAPARAPRFSGASCTRCSASFPSAPFCWSTCFRTLRRLKGPAAYGAQVKFLNSLPLVRVLEWVFIFLPILYHAGYGVYIWLRGKSNIVYYPWAGNWMYVAQRYTGLIAFAYILQHVIRQRFMGISLPENPYAAFHKVQVELSNPWMAGRLCDCDDRHLLAFRLWRLAVCGQVGHYPGRDRAQALWLCVRRVGRAPGGDGAGQHLGLCRRQVSERSGESLPASYVVAPANSGGVST